MNEKLLELAARRGALSVRIAAQRAALTQHSTGLAVLLSKGDAALRGLDWLKQHPLAVGVAVAAAVVIRPRRTWRLVRRGFIVWRGWRIVRNTLGLH
jgi:hypothetical protein